MNDKPARPAPDVRPSRDGRRTPWDNPRFRSWLSVLRAERALVRNLTRSLAELDLKLPQLDMLMNLYRHPGISQHDLARRLLVGRSNISMLLPQLEEAGLILREGDPADRRVIRLSLTPHGESKLMDALDIYTALIEQVMNQSTPDECETVNSVMQRISDTLKEG